MTETVQAFCDWALKQDSVKHVIAETDVDGLSSQKILKRCGFKEYARNNTVDVYKRQGQTEFFCGHTGCHGETHGGGGSCILN